MTILIIYNISLYIFDKADRKISLNKIDFAFLLFVIWNLFSSIITHDTYINDKTGELFLLTIFYFIVKGQLADYNNQNSFLIISTVFLLSVAIAEVVIGMLQLYHIISSNNPYFKVTGTFNNPTPYALLLTIIYAYALAVYSFNVVSFKPIKYLALGSCFLILNIIPFTLNRASWIGIFASTILIGLYKLSQSKYLLKLNKWKKFGLATIIIILVGLSLPFLYNFKKGSSDGRLLVWKVSGNIIKEHPLIGIGYGRFHSEYNLYQADYFKGIHYKDEELLAGDVQLAFNDYIEVLVETGVVGLLLFFGLIFLILSSLKLGKDSVYLFLCPFLIFLILSTVSYPVNTLITKILFIFFIASISSYVSNYEDNSLIFNFKKWLIVVFLIVSIPLSIKQVAKYQKYKTWAFASKEYDADNYEVSEVYYRQIYKALKCDSYLSLRYAECLYKNQKYAEALNVLNAVKEIVPDPELFLLMGNAYINTWQFSKAKLCFEEAGFMVPGKILPKYYLTKLYYDTGENEMADSLVNNILTMEIKIKSDTTQTLINEIKMMYQNHNKNNRLNMPGMGI